MIFAVKTSDSKNKTKVKLKVRLDQTSSAHSAAAGRVLHKPTCREDGVGSHLAESQRGQWWQFLEVRVVEAPRRVARFARRYPTDGQLRLWLPVGRGERQALVGAGVHRKQLTVITGQMSRAEVLGVLQTVTRTHMVSHFSTQGHKFICGRKKSL